MARPFLSQIRSIGDFATIFRWNMTIVQAPSVGGTYISDTDMNYRCESTTIPKATNNTFEVNIRGHKTLNNGIVNYDNTLSLTFVDTVDNKLRNFFKTWREALWTPDTGAAKGTTNELKAKFLLQLLDNTDAPKWSITIHGVMLQDYDFGTLDGTSSDAIRPTVTFTYDYFEDAAV